jgi:hypothetical protein
MDINLLAACPLSGFHTLAYLPVTPHTTLTPGNAGYLLDVEYGLYVDIDIGLISFMSSVSHSATSLLQPVAHCELHMAHVIPSPSST